MLNFKLLELDLFKILLQFLLDDFRYWFECFCELLEREKIFFLSSSEYLDLFNRVK